MVNHTYIAEDALTATNRLPPPTNDNMEERLQKIDEVKYFLGTAPNDWEPTQQVHAFPLATGESISCVLWNDLFHVTGTDIVRCLLYRFHLFGRPVTNLKKFEEGVFSDLRNLKPGMDASLEEPKSEFLAMLYKNNCIRTQKKQKVFFWFSVPHDRLFLDALERDLKREKLGQEPTSIAVAEPATSLSLDTTQELFDQLKKSMSLSAVAVSNAIDKNLSEFNQLHTTFINKPTISLVEDDKEHDDYSFKGHRSTRSLSSIPDDPPLATVKQTSYSAGTSPKLTPVDFFEMENMEKQQKIFGAYSLFEGSPTYKQRQRKRTYSALTPFTYETEISPQNLFHVLRKQQLQQQGQELAEKSYVCPLPQCSRVFKRLEHLKRHFRTHTLERPYSCSMCGKHFSRTDNLAQHKKTHDRNKNLCMKEHKPAKNIPAQPAQDLTPPISDDDVETDFPMMLTEPFLSPTYEWQSTTSQEEAHLSWYSSMKSPVDTQFYGQQIYTW